MRCPPNPELLGPGGQLTDEVGESLVVRVSAGGRPEDADHVGGDRLPIDEELLRLLVQEDEPSAVDGSDGVGVLVRVERLPEGVGGEHVEPFVLDERGTEAAAPS